MKILIHALIWFLRQVKSSFKKDTRKDILKLLSKLLGLKKNKKYQFIDIGSHSGTWTFSFLKLFKNSSVICFEAYDYYYKVFKILIKLLKYNQISVYNYGVTDSVKNIYINYQNKKTKKLLTGENFISDNPNNKFNYKKVNGMSIDQFKDKKISNLKIVKIDVEGNELLVLKGAKKTIKQFNPIIIFEYDAKYTKKYKYDYSHLKTFFLNIDYKIFVILDNKFFLCTKKNINKNKSANYYAIPKKLLKLNKSKII